MNKYVGWSTNMFGLQTFKNPSYDSESLWVQICESSSRQVTLTKPYNLKIRAPSASSGGILCTDYVKPAQPSITGHEQVLRLRFEHYGSNDVPPNNNPYAWIGLSSKGGPVGTTPNQELGYLLQAVFYTYSGYAILRVAPTTSPIMFTSSGGTTIAISPALAGYTAQKNQIIEIILSCIKGSDYTWIRMVVALNGQQKWASGYMCDTVSDNLADVWNGLCPAILVGATGVDGYVTPFALTMNKSG